MGKELFAPATGDDSEIFTAEQLPLRPGSFRRLNLAQAYSPWKEVGAYQLRNCLGEDFFALVSKRAISRRKRLYLRVSRRKKSSLRTFQLMG